ncbi:MAG: tetratricopeptide repeat protein [Caldilineaceae bacterium]|nr:tetratricopeptide repeat protein [Caldilineaceae bacterium]
MQTKSTFDQTKQTVHGDQTNVVGDYRVTNIYPPPRSVADEPPADLFWLTAGRAEELAQLDAWYDAAVADTRGEKPRAVIVTGAAGMGKREIVQRWCAVLAERERRPTVVQTTYLPAYWDAERQETFYASHARWGQAWMRFAARLRTLYPQAEVLGGRGWVALAAQIAAQSERARSGLATAQAPVSEPDAEALRQLMSQVLVDAARAESPLVVIVDHVELAPTPLQMLLHTWNKVLDNLPFLLVLLVDAPQPLHGTGDQHGQESEWLRWLREQSAPHSAYSYRTLHVWPLRSQAVEALLAADSAAMAPVLHELTGGAPSLLLELLRHWEQQGMAAQQDDGRWQLAGAAMTTFSGSLYAQYVERPLQAYAACAQELGYDVDWETLARWLSHAAWEGEVFSDESVAHAVGMHGERLEEFQEVLDEVLTGPRPLPNPPQGEGTNVGMLVELEETVVLPTAEVGRRERHMALYRFEPRLLARVLVERQREPQRHEIGAAAIQGLIAAYRPLEREIAPLLVQMAKALGRMADAETFQGWIAPAEDLEHSQFLLAILRTLATETYGQMLFVSTVLDFFHTFHGKIHPQAFFTVLQDALVHAQSLKHTGHEGHLLYHIGDVYADLGDKQQAIAIYNQALPLLRKAGDIRGETITLNKIGDVYYKLGEKQQALDFYNQALPLRRKAGDISGEATTLTSMGCVYSDMGENQRALDLFNQALPLIRKIGNISGEAATVMNMGSVYAALSESQWALDLYHQALPLFRMVGDIGNEASALVSMGNVYSELGENQQALDLYHQALPLFTKVGDMRGEAYTLTSMGSVYAGLNETQQALDLYHQALPLRRKVGDTSGEAYTLSNMGNVYSALGENQRALDFHNQALPLFRKVGEFNGEAFTLTNMGIVYSNLGEKQKALKLYEQALPLQRNVGNIRGEAFTLTNMGIAYSDLGEQQQALELYHHALPLRRKVGDINGEAFTLANMGKVYADLGEKTQALDLYNQALSFRRKVGDIRGEAYTLTGMGDVYSVLGETQQALDLYNQALPLRRKVGDISGEAETLSSMGRVYADLDEKQQALELYYQALPLRRKVGDISGEAETLFGMGRVYADLGEKQQALDLYHQALPLYERASSPKAETVRQLINELDNPTP